MKYLLYIILGVAFSTVMAQRHEIGVIGGGANVIGDIGRDNYINPMPVSYKSSKILNKLPIAVGILYRFNFNPHMGARFNLMYAKVIGNDAVAPESYKKDRNYSYNNSIIEASLLYEYNFFDINNEDGRKHSPYIFAGVGAFMYDKLSYNVNHTFKMDDLGVVIGEADEPTTEISTKSEKETGFSVPMGFGYKIKYKRNFVISAEVGFRYTQTDNLDHSFANYKDFSFNADPGLDQDVVNQLNTSIVKSRQVGNTSNYDWYVFTGLTLTYTFGRPPCYCD